MFIASALITFTCLCSVKTFYYQMSVTSLTDRKKETLLAKIQIVLRVNQNFIFLH